MTELLSIAVFMCRSSIRENVVWIDNQAHATKQLRGTGNLQDARQKLMFARVNFKVDDVPKTKSHFHMQLNLEIRNTVESWI
jgi:hypothetical protein